MLPDLKSGIPERLHISVTLDGTSCRSSKGVDSGVLYRAVLHTHCTPTALPTSLQALWDRIGSHIRCKSWWKTYSQSHSRPTAFGHLVGQHLSQLIVC